MPTFPHRFFRRVIALTTFFALMCQFSVGMIPIALAEDEPSLVEAPISAEAVSVAPAEPTTVEEQTPADVAPTEEDSAPVDEIEVVEEATVPAETTSEPTTVEEETPADVTPIEEDSAPEDEVATPEEDSAEEVAAPVEEVGGAEETTAEIAMPDAEQIIPVEEIEEIEVIEEAEIPETPAVSSGSSDSQTEPEAIWTMVDGIATTNDSVALGTIYIAPQNEQVTVTFTKLPENSGKLSIEEIILTEEQIASLGALSDKAYDITSDMADGTFAFDLTLPKPVTHENVQIKFAEDVDALENAETVESEDVKDEGDSVSTSLDHFTVYVVTIPSPDTANSVLINEIVVNPISGAQEWVELYNNTDSEIDLSGWIISDGNTSTTDDITIPASIIISARGFLAFDHNEGWLNDSCPETVILKNISAVLIDSVQINTSSGAKIDRYPNTGESVARTQDGGSEWKVSAKTTKGATNITPVFNGDVTGHLEADELGQATGFTTGDFITTITGNLNIDTYVDGQYAEFSGTITGDIEGDFSGAVNYNGFDTLSAQITNSRATGYVYLIGYFAGATGDFIGEIITQDTPINFVDSITITGPTSIPAGTTVTFTADTEVAWTVWTTSGDESGLATINEETGELTTTGAGQITVIASALDGSLITKNQTVTITPVFNGEVAGFVGAKGLDVSGNTTGEFDTTITGNLDFSTYVEGQHASFSGEISGDITGTLAGGINWNGYDTLFAEVTESGASGHVYLIGEFSGGPGEFVGRFVTQEDEIDFVEEITILGGTSVPAGSQLEMSATVSPAEASDEVAWSVYVNDLEFATINKDTGVLTAIKPGTVTVIASALDGSLVTKNQNVTIIDTIAPNLTVTGFTADGVGMSGTIEGGYTLNTDNNANTNYEIQFADGSIASEDLQTETVGLNLIPTTGQTDALIEYYLTKPEAYRTYLNAAAAGTSPFAYIKTDGTTIQLLDGAQYTLATVEKDMIIPGNYPLGTYAVSGTIHDVAGNPTTVTYILIVAGDRVAPNTPIITTSDQLVNTDTINITGTAEARSTITITGGASTANGTADEVGAYNIEVTLTQNAVNNLNVTATDTSNNESSPATVVITHDNIAPTVVLSDDHNDNIIKAGDVVVFTATFIDTNGIDEETGPTISIHSTGIVSNASMTKVNNLVWTYEWTVPAGNDGSHSVTISATDNGGNTNSTATGENSYTIDNTGPVITLYGDNPATLEIHHEYGDQGYSASDDVDGNVTGSVVMNTSGINKDVVGSYTVTYNVVDSNDNSADEVTRTVNVVDSIEEAFNGVSGTLAEANIANNLDDVTTDNAASFSGLYFEKTGFGKISFEGSLDLTDQVTIDFLTALDSKLSMDSGRIALDISTATELADKGAVLEMYNIMSPVDITNIIVRDDTGTIIDPSEIISGFSYDPELDKVTFSAAHFTQFDIDTTAPVIAAHDNVGPIEATTATGATVTYDSPDATDNIDPTAVATCSPASGTAFVIGNTTVTCNKTDTVGNTATATTFVVQVVDTTSLAPVSLTTGSATVNSLTLNWTNNELNGSNYVIKQSTSEITADNFAAATTLGGAPTVASGAQGYVAKNLSANTTYYFAIKLTDAVGNSSDIATTSGATLTVTAVSTDEIAPGAIGDLSASVGSPATSKINLTWTATGDDADEGIATKYIIKRSTSAITAENFDSATTIFNTLSPKSAGSAETFTVTGLSANTKYYFAIKVQDEVPNTSAISNVESKTTENNLPIITSIDKAEGVNDEEVDIVVTGENFIDSTNTLRFSNASNTFDLTTAYNSETPTHLTASVPTGAPIGTYNLKVINDNGTSVALPLAYEVIAASIPLPSVSDLIPANIGSNDSDIKITIYGANFTEGATVELDTGLALTNVVVVDNTKITATIPGTLAANTYDIKVTTAGGTNTISSVKLNVKAPVTITSGTLEQTTKDPIDLSGTNTIPVQMTLQSDETIINTDTVATIEVVIPPATEIKKADGTAYTGNINPPQVVKTTNDMKATAGEDAVVITMGNPDEKITFSNDFVTTVTLDTTQNQAPLIWYYNPSTGLEIAGKDGVKDGVTYVKEPLKNTNS